MEYNKDAFNTIGDTADPVGFNSEVYQVYSDTCAIQSQKLILEKFGIDISQEDLIRESYENGWYDPDSGGGTCMSDIGKLLENHGVPVVQTSGNNIFSLARELAQGHQVIVGVDSGELWNRGSWTQALEDYFIGEIPDHALIVSGLDASDPENVQVVLTDPGTGQERVRYSEREFLEAWKDSDCWMMSTEVAPPDEYLYWSCEDHGFARIPSSTLEKLGACEFNVSSSEYGGFIDTLCENPDMSWDDILQIGLAVISCVKTGISLYNMFTEMSDDGHNSALCADCGGACICDEEAQGADGAISGGDGDSLS